MHQSVCRDLDQSQRNSSSSSSTCAAANSNDVIGSQSATGSRQQAQPEHYKRGHRGRTNYIAISDLEADASTDTHLQNSSLSNTNSGSTLGSAMARTKQTDRKTDEDRPPRATHPYVCGVWKAEYTVDESPPSYDHDPWAPTPTGRRLHR